MSKNCGGVSSVFGCVAAPCGDCAGLSMRESLIFAVFGLEQNNKRGVIQHGVHSSQGIMENQ